VQGNEIFSDSTFDVSLLFPILHQSSVSQDAIRLQRNLSTSSGTTYPPSPVHSPVLRLVSVLISSLRQRAVMPSSSKRPVRKRAPKRKQPEAVTPDSRASRSAAKRRKVGELRHWIDDACTNSTRFRPTVLVARNQIRMKLYMLSPSPLKMTPTTL
jgi:hypothetical protein